MKYLETFFSGLAFSSGNADFAATMHKKNLKEINKHLNKTAGVLWAKTVRNAPSDQTLYLGFGKNNLIYNVMETSHYDNKTGKNIKQYFIKKQYYSAQGDKLYDEYVDGNLDSGGPLIYSSLKSAKNRCASDYKKTLDKSQLEWLADSVIVENGEALLNEAIISKEIENKDDLYRLVQCAKGRKAFYVIARSYQLDSVDESYYIEKINLDGSLAYSLNSHFVNYKTAIKLAQKDYGKDLNLEKTM